MLSIVSVDRMEINQKFNCYISSDEFEKKKYKLVLYEGRERLVYEEPGPGRKPTFFFDRLKPAKHTVKDYNRVSWEKPGFWKTPSSIHTKRGVDCPRCLHTLAWEGFTYRLCKRCGKIYERVSLFLHVR